MKKNLRITLSALFIFLSAFAQSALAEYQYIYLSGTHTATLAYKTSAISQTADVKVSPYNNLANMGQDMLNGLRTEFYSKIAAEVGGVPYYKSHSVSMAGPLEMQISGSPGSTLANVTFSVGSMGAQVNLSKSQYIAGVFRVTASCSVTVNTGKVGLVGTYDLVSGTTVLRIADTSLLQPTHSENCSSSFGWIPIIGGWVDSLISRTANAKVESAIQKALAAAKQPLAAMQFAGLNTIIPDGKFLIGGTDWGAYIKYNLVGLFQSNSISIKFDERNANPSSTLESKELFSISFNNSQLRFSLKEDRRFDQTFKLYWGCPSYTNQGDCPGGTTVHTGAMNSTDTLIGYLKTTGAAGTTPLYWTCTSYGGSDSDGSCQRWAISSSAGTFGTQLGFLSTSPHPGSTPLYWTCTSYYDGGAERDAGCYAWGPTRSAGMMSTLLGYIYSP